MENPMRQSVTIRLDPKILEVAKSKADSDHRSLTNYIELLLKRDAEGSGQPELTVFASEDVRDFKSVRFPEDTEHEFNRRSAVFDAVLDNSGR
jgi:hypothetical protein